MKRLSILFLTLAATVGAGLAEDMHHEYIVAYTATSATSNVVTVQQPATGARTTLFVSVYAECTVECTVTFERDGTAATETTLTPANVNTANRISSSIQSADATAFRSSDVGVGTVLGPAGGYTVAANDWRVFNVQGKVLAGDGTGKNFTIRMASASAGTLTVVVKWREY